MTEVFSSPFQGVPETEWLALTQSLVESYPVSCDTMVEVVLESWDSIFESAIGKHGVQIGKDIFPTPQIMASYLHELIPLELAARFPGEWRADEAAHEKDLVYIPDSHFSTELKTSSSKGKIYANRSYAQPPGASGQKKNKNGYYLAINFEKFSKESPNLYRPRITLVRLGWLDHTDWKPQAKPTGQQASLYPESEKGRLLPIYAL